MSKRIWSVILILSLLVLIIFSPRIVKAIKRSDKSAGWNLISNSDEKAEFDEVTENVDKKSVYFWYTDDTLTNYINAAAVAYNEANGTRVVPVLKSSVGYLEAINASTIENDIPDMYLLPHNALGEAYLAGLAEPIELGTEDFDNTYIGQSKNAVKYKDKLMAYPLYFDTTAFIYNKSYINDMALIGLREDRAAAAAESEMESMTSGKATTDTANDQSDGGVNGNDDSVSESGEFTEEAILAKIEEILPDKISDILTVANDYDTPEGVDVFFTWDVGDIFYNYFFVGDAIELGGDGGWDTSNVDIYNEDAIRSLEAYQDLNNFFSIESQDCSYEQVVNDFIEGKLVFTIVTTDAIAKIEGAKSEGRFEYDYGVTLIPDMSEDMETRSMSVTECIAVNPYSKHMDVANSFAGFITNEFASNLYAKAGKLSVSKNVSYDFESLSVFAKEYSYSSPIPKMLETSDFWIDLEKTFLIVWNGGDANSCLKSLAEQVNYQITGEACQLDPITIDEEVEEIEYLDEEEYKKSLQTSDSEEEE